MMLRSAAGQLHPHYLVRNGRAVDGIVHENDFPVVTEFSEECRVRADSFMQTVIDGKSESGPSRIAPGSRRNIMNAHRPFGSRGQLAVEQIQGEHLGGHLVAVFIHPQHVVGKYLVEIADIALVVCIHARFDQIHQRARRRRCRTPALNGPAFGPNVGILNGVV